MSESFKLCYNNRTILTPDSRQCVSVVIEDIQEFLDKFYPIGTYYCTINTEFNPNVSWVGQWELDTEGLVMKSGINSDVTGGEITHAITVDELPKHTHRTTRQLMAAGKVNTATRGNDTFTGKYYDWTHVYNSGSTQPYKAGNRSTNSTTNTSNSHNNVQKSMVCYRWHRVA